MEEITELANLLPGMPPAVLVLVLTLAAFGLAAYAIHAVLTVSKRSK